jgi:hypothetical protein
MRMSMALNQQLQDTPLPAPDTQGPSSALGQLGDTRLRHLVNPSQPCVPTTLKTNINSCCKRRSVLGGGGGCWLEGQNGAEARAGCRAVACYIAQ